jgi:hypothetical protein
MLYIFDFLALVILFIITYQDFAFRAVTWIYFPVLAAICIFIRISLGCDKYSIFFDAVCNMLFVYFQLLGVYIYFIFKDGLKFNTFSTKIGSGDILFLIACGFLFPFFQYIIFYISSLLFSLLIYFIISFARKPAGCKTIPLAGLQSIYVSVWILLLMIGFNLFFYGEVWVTKLFGYEH